MPRGYEKMEKALEKGGMKKKNAQGKAARIWNSQHPDNPVGRKHKKK